MKKVTIIIGEPATGKTMLVRRLIVHGPWVFRSPKWVPHHQSAQRDSAILGDYHDRTQMYAGTDRLSMAVQPHARKWINDSSLQHFLMEGDRLGNMKFIRELIADGHDVKVIRLMADSFTRTIRSTAQGRKQDPQFLRSRMTKLTNMSRELSTLHCVAYQEIPHVTADDTQFIIANLIRSDSERRI